MVAEQGCAQLSKHTREHALDMLLHIGRVCNSSESSFAEKIPDKSENARAIVRACGICDPHKTWSGVSTGTWQRVG